MSGIGSIGGADRPLPQNQIAAVQSETKPVEKEPEDKVHISKAREVFEKVVGAPVALITGVANVAGGFLGGGIAGAGHDKDDAKVGVGLGSGATYIGGGAAAGFMLAGIPGAIAGGIGGIIFTALSGGSGSMEAIGEKVGEDAVRVTSDNKDSGRKIKDGVRDFTEGALSGTFTGSVEGFKHGDAYGAGIVSGIIEGGKGVVSSALGKYEKSAEIPAETTPQPEVSTGKKILKSILHAPRAIVDTAAGLVGGVIGMGMEAVDGLLQGIAVGAGSDAKADAKFHRRVMTFETLLGGAAAGFALGGPLGAAIGGGCGLVAGRLIKRFEKKTDTDKVVTQNLTDAVKYAQKDNTYENGVQEYGGRDKNAYETFRDGIEGALTGAAAGGREGFKAGYAAGEGLIEGVIEGTTGVLGGLFGGITKKG